MTAVGAEAVSAAGADFIAGACLVDFSAEAEEGGDNMASGVQQVPKNTRRVGKNRNKCRNKLNPKCMRNT